MRLYKNSSVFIEDNLALSLAPALTPKGFEEKPTFFEGYALYPQVLSRGLLVLADITATRYFKYVPVSERDPVISAQGDRIRYECFSACNGVYARLDLLQSGLEGEIGFGTTNIDISVELRKALSNIKSKDKIHLNIGSDGLKSTRFSKADTIIVLTETVYEKPVAMPERWIRALGNTAEIHQNMKAVFTLNKIQSQMFITTLPPVTGKSQSGWLTLSKTGVKLLPRKTKECVYISGLHRLSALKRVMTNIESTTFYMLENEEQGHFMLEVELKGARLTLSLTSEPWQGYSGEGSLLTSLANDELLSDVEAIDEILSFNSVIKELEIAEKFDLSQKRIKSALAYLAVSGKLGYDVHDNAYFHRELPSDPNRILKDNPRLVGARKLLDNIKKINENQWLVKSNSIEYRVIFSKDDGELPKCTCTWYLNHKNNRGPCKHILAVQLKEGKYE